MTHPTLTANELNQQDTRRPSPSLLPDSVRAGLPYPQVDSPV